MGTRATWSPPHAWRGEQTDGRRPSQKCLHPYCNPLRFLSPKIYREMSRMLENNIPVISLLDSSRAAVSPTPLRFSATKRRIGIDGGRCYPRKRVSVRVSQRRDLEPVDILIINTRGVRPLTAGWCEIEEGGGHGAVYTGGGGSFAPRGVMRKFEISRPSPPRPKKYNTAASHKRLIHHPLRYHEADYKEGWW